MTKQIKVLKYNWKNNVELVSIETELGTFIREDEIKKEKDTYAMEFLKECLPEKAKPEPNKHSFKFSNSNTHSRGWNDCRELTLNNANNKQDDRK